MLSSPIALERQRRALLLGVIVGDIIQSIVLILNLADLHALLLAPLGGDHEDHSDEVPALLEADVGIENDGFLGVIVAEDFGFCELGQRAKNVVGEDVAGVAELAVAGWPLAPSCLCRARVCLEVIGQDAVAGVLILAPFAIDIAPGVAD